MDTILLFMLPAGLWAQDAGVAATTAAPDATAGALGELATGLNTVWMLLAAMLVFFMQPGFALVEAGFIRTKNTANVLMKNLVDFMFGSICNLQIFLCLFLEKLNMPQNTPVTKAS